MDGEEAGAFEFDGTWREYAPIAMSNALLTFVTLGIYRFWATTRTRRYLWSRTRFIDDRLEWAGTGGELFKGALMAALVIFLPLFVVNVVARRLILNGHPVAGGLMMLAMFTGLYVLVGAALFRALRYRLSRTYWRGIRGGSEDNGLAYGWSYLWKNVVGVFSLGLLMPWSMVALWNERWNGMSFGPYRFEADARVDGLMKRFLLCYLAPFAVAVISLGLMVIAYWGAQAAGGNPRENQAFWWFTIIPAILLAYVVFGVVVMAFYAKYYRQVVEATSLHTLTFRFSASTKDWIKLLLGDVGLVIVTVGLGALFIQYRHWKFQVSHMHAFGTIDPEEMTQSTAPLPSQGEGLLDAFDMGAI